MALLPLNNIKSRKRITPLRDKLFSDFSGGINHVDNEITMRSKYAVILDNFQRAGDGSRELRFGTNFVTDVKSIISGDILEMIYFTDHIIVFTVDGQIAKVDANYLVTVIWNTTIAAALPGAPTGWSTGITAIDVTEFRGELVCQNGTDKPILISSALAVTYLQDLATSSNVNTPIGKYVTTVDNFCVVAGITSAVGDIYISNAATSGTWPGDTAPNDGITMNISAFVPSTDGVIIGLNSFRNKLFVHFDNVTVVVALNIYNSSGVHTPNVADTIIEQGTINHRTAITRPTNLYVGDIVNIYKLKRNINELFDSREISTLISPTYKSSLSLTNAERSKCFAVYNPSDTRYMLFIPDGSKMRVWSTIIDDTSRNNEWEHFTGWSWSSGCTSRKGRVFFSEGTKIFIYGNSVYENENYHADYMNDRDSNWITTTGYVVGDLVRENGVSYKCLVNHTANIFTTDLANLLWEIYEGEDISFIWDTPWLTTGVRTKKKRLQYFGIATTGLAQFDIDFFVDKIVIDIAGNPDPAATMAFVGGDSAGFGNSEQPFGGGRRTADERNWGIPIDFKILKFRVSGATKKPLNIITISLLYNIGTYKR